WLYNPFTGEEIRPDLRMPAIPSRRKLLKGYVSQTEWDEAYFLKEESRAEITLKPVGSIAYKLMLLALGKCDFVVTKKDKCIWDIAGGSTLLNQLGLRLYGDTGEILELKQKTIKGPLLWCQERDYAFLQNIFFKNE